VKKPTSILVVYVVLRIFEGKETDPLTSLLEIADILKVGIYFFVLEENQNG